EAVAEANAKIILIGDRKQLQSISAGGGFAAVADLVGGARLTEITRQTKTEDVEVVKLFAKGGDKAAAALKSLAGRELLTVHEDRREAIRELVKTWAKEAGHKPEDHVCFAPTRREVAEVNAAIQEVRIRAGQLGAESLRMGGTDIHVGERVM